ncbi:phosphotransferase family protein [Paracoccus sp. JM45]|uniref:phosphotransferase family protein n=1 Tax=Paracoccus sp. JM45 TaxID=2283626 RepID=UPI000E6C3CD8|nr:phosphotransferase family protein [Paracoccus sp. JM45]RJE79610.1 phosphotransferase family protein [Paracoccus sp. JM45]
MSENGGPPLVDVSAALSFDERALKIYLQDKLPDFEGDLTVRQFNAGQSNPTYQLAIGQRKYVLRKKPPGTLLPSAHAVDREFRVMDALRDTPVPVPRMLHLSQDPSVIGSDFYVMEMVEGRVFHDPSLPDQTPDERRAFYHSFIKALADLHAVNPEAIGLADFGRPTGFLSRQVQRWSKQYVATETETIAAMDKLMEWLPANLPDDDEASIVHGDYRPGNAIVGAKSPEVLALLDWELCTLGHPLADLGYMCANYHAESLPTGRFKGLDFKALGIPTEQEFLDLYCHYSGRKKITNHLFFVVFSFFRSAAIIQGVYKRGLAGNASSHRALELGHLARVRAENAWNIVDRYM